MRHSRLLPLLLLAASPAAAQQFRVPRALPGDRVPTSPAGVVEGTATAAGDGAHLVVWSDGRTDLAGVTQSSGYSLQKQDVFAMRVDADGVPLDDGPLLISGIPFEHRRAQVAWNGVDQWLVVWEARRVLPTTTSVGIQGCRVHRDGRVLDGTPFLIEDSDGHDEHFPVVAGDAGQWVVVWQDYHETSGDSSMKGAVVQSDGTISRKRTLQRASPGFMAPTNPSIAAVNGTYLTTFEHYTSGSSTGWDVYGRFFDANIAALGPEFPIDVGAGNGVGSWVSSNGTEFLVTWSGPRAAVVDLAGTVTPPGGRPLSIGSFSTGFDRMKSAWIGDRWLVVGTGSAFGPFGVVAEELDANAVPIDDYTLVSRPAYTRSPSVGALGGRAVVAWADDELEYADTMAVWAEAGGVTGTPARIDRSPPAQVHVDADGDEVNGYAVAWLDRRSGGTRVLAQRLGPDGRALDAEPVVVATGGAHELRSPAIARGANAWLVVWADDDVGGETRVQARGMALDGTLGGQTIDVLEGVVADVAWSNGVFLVTTIQLPRHEVQTVRARRVDEATGSVLDATDLAVSGSFTRAISVGTAGDRFLVAAQRHANHDSPYSAILATFVDSDGSVGTSFYVEQHPDSTRAPFVSSGPTEAFIVYSGPDDSWGRAVDANGTLYGPVTGVHLTYAPGDQVQPTGGRFGDGWLAAWTDHRIHPPLEAGVGDVYAARFDADETILDLDGIPVANDPDRFEGTPVIVGGDAQALLVLVAFDESLGAWRIETTTLRDDTLGERYCSPAVPNSSGTFASTDAFGDPGAFVNDVTLTIEGGPAGSFGYFLTSMTEDEVHQPGGSQGTLCLGGNVGRFAAHVFQLSPAGTASFQPDLSSMPVIPARPAFPGETWRFQAWFRDANPQVTSNFSDAVAILFE